MEINNLKIVYINLLRRPNKAEKLEKHLNELGLTYQRFNAIDGLDLPKFDLTHRILKNTIKRGHMGCYLSHKKCYENFLNTDKEYLLVLEDDINFSYSNTKEKLNFIIDHITLLKKKKNINIDFLYLGRSIVTKTFVNYNKHNSKQYEDEYIFSPLVFGYGFHCYIISKDGARKFLKLLDNNEKLFHNELKLFCSIDNMDYLMQDLKKRYKDCKELDIYVLKDENFVNVDSPISDTGNE